MPTLPLSGSTPLDGGALPVRVDADVLAIFPLEVRRSATAPVRDGLVAALKEILKEYQRRSRRSAALSDILRSTGSHLDGLASDHGVFRQPGETNEALRMRVLGIPDLVSPSAILAAVNAILVSHTSRRAKYFESELDQWFVEDGTATWQSFVYNGLTGATPHYPDRLFADDAIENGGYAIPGREVLGAWAVGDALGRHFILRIPPLESVDNDGAYAVDALDDGMFVADGTDTSGAESDGTVTSFIFTDQSLSDELYAAIVSVVEMLKGQGIRWTAIVDPLL